MNKIIIILLFSFNLLACSSSAENQEHGVLGNALNDTTTASVGGAPVGALMGDASSVSEKSE